MRGYMKVSDKLDMDLEAPGIGVLCLLFSAKICELNKINSEIARGIF